MSTAKPKLSENDQRMLRIQDLAAALCVELASLEEHEITELAPYIDSDTVESLIEYLAGIHG